MSTTITSRDRLIDILSLSYLGDLLREQLGDDAENYTWPDDFEKAVADIGFAGLVIRGESAPYDVIAIGHGLDVGATNSQKIFDVRSVRLIGTKSLLTVNLLRGSNELTSLSGEESLESIGSGVFYGTPLSGDLHLTNLVALGGTAFYNCASLENVYLPKLMFCLDSVFWGCTSLKTITIGSVGYPVTQYDYRFLQNCTQPDFVVTMFTDGTRVDNFVTQIRRVATNATIIMKAANELVYNGTTYAAGDTILTSEVTA